MQEEHRGHSQGIKVSIKAAEDDTKPRRWFRSLVVLFGGISTGLMLILRGHISITIMSVVNAIEFVDRGGNDNLISPAQWTVEIQQTIMSAHMIGFAIFQIPHTKLLFAKINLRWSTPMALFVCAISTALTPRMIRLGDWRWVTMLRVVNGIGAAPVQSAMNKLIEKWTPQDELRTSRMYAQMLSSSLAAIGPIMCALMAADGWSRVFYELAIVTGAFCLLWVALIDGNPEQSSLISPKELVVIADASKAMAIFNAQEVAEQDGGLNLIGCLREPTFYWYNLMWSLHASLNCFFQFVLPTYLRHILALDEPVFGVSIAVCLIQSGSILANLWPSYLLSWLRDKRLLGDEQTRRCWMDLLICIMVVFTWIYVSMFNDHQLPLLFLNRLFYGALEEIVGETRVDCEQAFNTAHVLGDLSAAVGAPLIGRILDEHGPANEHSWFLLFLLLSSMQLMHTLIYMTVVRAPVVRENKAVKPAATSAETHVLDCHGFI